MKIKSIIVSALVLGLMQIAYADCPKGQNMNNGQCINSTCPKNKVWAPSLGQCLTQKNMKQLKKNSLCPKGQSMNNGKCVNSNCPHGQVWAPSLGQCMTKKDFRKLAQ